jgi:hypothetical protein
VAAPVVQAVGALAAAASGTVQSVPIPAHQAGDKIFVATAHNGGQTMSAPAGWVDLLVGIMSGNADLGVALWYKQAATSGETFTATYSAAASATIGHYGLAFVVRGGKTTGGSGIETGGATSPTADNHPRFGPVTTGGPDRLVFAVCWAEGTPTWSNTYVAGWSEVEQVSSTIGGDMAFTVISKTQPAAATIPQGDFVQAPGTKSTAGFWASLAFAVAPADGDFDAAVAQTAIADATVAFSVTGTIDVTVVAVASADATVSTADAVVTQVAICDATVVTGTTLAPAGDAVIRADATVAYDLGPSYTCIPLTPDTVLTPDTLLCPGGIVVVVIDQAVAEAAAPDATVATSVTGTVTVTVVAVASADASLTIPLPTPTVPGPPKPARWVWELVRFDGERLAEITGRGRSLQLAVNASGSAKLSLDVYEAAAYPGLAVGQVDLLVSREGVPRFRGAVGGATGSDITVMGGAISFAATGIAELLGDRYIAAGTELAALEAAQMAWALIAATQSLPLGDLGILKGQLDDSVARTKVWDTPTQVLTAIRELAEMDDGFDFAVEPDLAGDYRFNVWHPRRGADRGVVLEADRNVGSISPTWDASPGRIANDVTVAGVDQVSVTETDAASAAAYRLRQRYLSISDADDATVLGSRARGELTRDAQVRPTGKVTLLPGAPDANLDAIGLGDVVEMDFDAGWARFQGPYRVLGIDVDLPDAPTHEALVLSVEPFVAA